jgi:hypothetical protein
MAYLDKLSNKRIKEKSKKKGRSATAGSACPCVSWAAHPRVQQAAFPACQIGQKARRWLVGPALGRALRLGQAACPSLPHKAERLLSPDHWRQGAGCAAPTCMINKIDTRSISQIEGGCHIWRARSASLACLARLRTSIK